MTVSKGLPISDVFMADCHPHACHFDRREAQWRNLTPLNGFVSPPPTVILSEAKDLSKNRK